MKLKLIFALSGCIVSLCLQAQNNPVDTVHIGRVDIVAPRLHHFSSVEKQVKIDSAIKEKYNNNDLANLLQKTSLVNISSNGSLGGLSTVSMRGASPHHTSVNWYGIPVNSVSTGTADLSLINAGAFDNVEVIYGASGSLYGSGTLGGAIELSNTPRWNNQSEIKVNTEIGSFSNYKNRIQGKYSNATFSYNGQAFLNYGKNNYTYTDFYDFGFPTERLNHNENKAYGTIHDFHFKLKQHFIDFGAWYQVKEKNIGGLMGIGEPVSFQEQKDSSLRIFVGWKSLLGKFRTEFKSAYLYDFLRYTDKENAQATGYKIYSEMSSEKWLNDANLRWYMANQLSLDANVKFHWLKGLAPAFAKTIYEREARLALAAKYSPRFGTFVLSYAKEWNSVFHSPASYSLNALLHVVPQVVDLRGKLSSHYRRPTFNDLYWIPGGNLDLKPEEGANFEIGTVLLPKKIWRGTLSADLNFYRAKNKNTIAWKPNGSVWGAFNTGEIITQGVDIEAICAFKIGKNKLSSMLKYGYNEVFDNNKESEKYKETLAYRPHHLAKAVIGFARGKWSLGTIGTFRSHSKTWENQKVKGHELADVNGSYHFDTGFAKLRITGRIENLFDKSYELVRSYPMPGRAYYFGASIIF